MKFLAILNLIFLSSCAFIASRPSSGGPPSVDQCVVYVDGTVDQWGLICSNLVSHENRWIPLIEAHKYTAFSPDQYELMRAWLKGQN